MVDKAEDRLQIVCKPLKSDEAQQQNLYVSTIEAEIIAILYSEKACSVLIFECGALVSCFVCRQQTIVWWEQTIV